MTVTNVDNLMAVQSSQFKLQEKRWRLIVYKNHLGQLGVRLVSNESSEGVICNVEMTVKLMAKPPMVPLEHHDTHQFKGYEVSVVKFYEKWHDLQRPENGYVENNQIILLKIVE